MLIVSVYPGIPENHMHITQIYAGLYDLQAQGIIILKFSVHPEHKLRYSGHTLWLEVTDDVSGKKSKMFFDMADWSKIASLEGLKECDFYFKRSHYKPSINKLDLYLRNKVFPYGLNYACKSGHETGYFIRFFYYIFNLEMILKNPFLGIKDLISMPVKLFLSKFNIDSDYVNMHVKDFESQPSEPAEAKILFQTRVWTTESCPDIDPKELNKLNDNRADTIRALKDEFKGDFVGGLESTDFAKKYYPDCLTDNNFNRREYFKLVRKCLITINSTGLHNSSPWKLAEYIAASRCIISEPLIYDLPTPLIDGKNYFVFRTPNECIQLCKKILEDKNLAQTMREHNFRYYQDEIKPSALIANCLKKSTNLTI